MNSIIFFQMLASPLVPRSDFVSVC